MSFPAPKPGLVIRYAFLWSNEARSGAREGAKDRPCAIVVATRRSPLGDIETVVAPITPSPPLDDASVEIPAKVARALGLDDRRHWIRTDELNSFAWPGYDLRQIPGRPGEVAYGLLPKALYETLRAGILERWRRGRMKVRSRD